MNRGPELLGPPSPGPKNTAGEVIYLAENTKSIKTLGVGGLHRFPDPVAGPRAPKPHLHSQHFGLPVLALGGRPRELRAPKLLLNQGPSEPCYATDNGRRLPLAESRERFIGSIKLKFHRTDTDTDTDFLADFCARILARKSACPVRAEVGQISSFVMNQ